MTQLTDLADKLADMAMKQRTVPLAACHVQTWGKGETVAMQIVTKAGERFDVSFGVGMHDCRDAQHGDGTGTFWCDQCGAEAT